MTCDEVRYDDNGYIYYADCDNIDSLKECYLCGESLSNHDDSGRCQTCAEESAEQGDAWDN